MPRKPPLIVTLETISADNADKDRRLNDLYIRMVKRRLLESGFDNVQKKAVLRELKSINKERF